MKKLVFSSLAAILVFSSVFAYADTYEDTRKNIGYELNTTINYLKELFIAVKDKLDSDDEKITELEESIEPLIEKSADPEQNLTVLEQGKSTMDICSSDEELYWTDSGWTCKEPSYKSDCDPAPGEYKVSSSNGYTCEQSGSYEPSSSGWGECNNIQKETQVKCMFTNSTTNFSYQTGSGCSSSDIYNILRSRQACGKYGAKSSCQCPTGYTYTYYGNDVARCIGPYTCPDGYSYSTLYQKCVVPVNISVNITQSYDSCSVGHYPASIDYVNGIVDFGSSNGSLGNSRSHTHTTKRTVQVTPKDSIQAKYIKVEGGYYFQFNGSYYSGSGRLNLNQNLTVNRTYTYSFYQRKSVGSNSTLVFNPKLYFLSLEDKYTPTCEYGSFNSSYKKCVSYVPTCYFRQSTL